MPKATERPGASRLRAWWPGATGFMAGRYRSMVLRSRSCGSCWFLLRIDPVICRAYLPGAATAPEVLAADGRYSSVLVLVADLVLELLGQQQLRADHDHRLAGVESLCIEPSAGDRVARLGDGEALIGGDLRGRREGELGKDEPVRGEA